MLLPSMVKISSHFTKTKRMEDSLGVEPSTPFQVLHISNVLSLPHDSLSVEGSTTFLQNDQAIQTDATE